MSIIEEMWQHQQKQRERGHERIKFGPELRARAQQYIEEQRQQGKRDEELAAELGLSRTTVQRWRRRQREEGGEAVPSNVLRPIRVREAPAMLRRMVAVVNRSGELRIEASAQEMAELVRWVRS